MINSDILINDTQFVSNRANFGGAIRYIDKIP